MDMNTLLPAIDVHAHFGTCKRGSSALADKLSSADARTVAERAEKLNIICTIVSPFSALLPRLGGNVLEGNREAEQAVTVTESLYQWVVVNPLEPESLIQTAKMLSTPKCVGIKIHPEEHGYKIKKQGGRLFEFAAKQNAIIISHSGEENSLPEEFIQFSDEFPEVRLILAHLGCGYDYDPTYQVRAIQSAKHDNVFVDTSSEQNIQAGLLEWAVKEIGAERILFGSDSPLYFLPIQRARIEYAEIDESEKRNILYNNAALLFNKIARRSFDEQTHI